MIHSIVDLRKWELLITGAILWRLQKLSIILITPGPPIGEPPMDFSPETNANTLAFIGGAAPTICNLPPGLSVLM